MGPLWAIPEEHAEVLEAYAAMPVATRMLIQRLNYEQTQKNDVSYWCLQFFIAGLCQDISMEVVKSGTTDMYQAFLTAHTYETELRDKQGKNGTPEPIKINEMEADFEEQDMNAEIDAIRRKYQKKMFSSNNGSAYQQRSNGTVRHATTVRKRITFKLIATKGKGITLHWSKSKNWENKRTRAKMLKPSSGQKTRIQLLCRTGNELHLQPRKEKPF